MQVYIFWERCVSNCQLKQLQTNTLHCGRPSAILLKEEEECKTILKRGGEWILEEVNVENVKLVRDGEPLETRLTRKILTKHNPQTDLTKHGFLKHFEKKKPCFCKKQTNNMFFNQYRGYSAMVIQG